MLGVVPLSPVKKKARLSMGLISTTSKLNPYIYLFTQRKIQNKSNDTQIFKVQMSSKQMDSEQNCKFNFSRCNIGLGNVS